MSESDMGRWDAVFLILTPKTKGEAFLFGVVAGWVLLLISFIIGNAIHDAVFEVIFP